TYAICKADMLIKGQDISKIVLGNTLSNDAFPNEKFDYMLSNPPYGVDWKKVKDDVETEAKKLGFKGRFGPGLPRISDGQMLFLLHLISKMHPKNSGETSRIAIVMNGSPLFSGGAGSGESEIRRYILENDVLEAIVALPTEMFYNTGIATYIWILSNNKEKRRIGKVQLINATDFFGKMRRSLGNKRRQFERDHIAKIVKEYGTFKDSDYSKLLPNEAFGYNTIVVERPLRLAFQITPERLDALAQEPLLGKNGINFADLLAALKSMGTRKFTSRTIFLDALAAALKKAAVSLKPPQYKAVWQALSERDPDAETCTNAKGEPEADPDLRDTEDVPLNENIATYVAREVLPYAPDAWLDASKTKMGFEIPFTRFFFHFEPPRALAEIESELNANLQRINENVRGITV
ncbi:MAG TPA: N-6 DNA methylase, partial [Candidatus Baltobacteraceae bacterium]|nr:N-6 DNA methylase [Candidatus Baltobacteraceae bacterium]